MLNGAVTSRKCFCFLFCLPVTNKEKAVVSLNRVRKRQGEKGLWWCCYRQEKGRRISEQSKEITG